LKQLQSLVLFLVLSTITYGQFPVQPSPTGSVNTLQRNAGAYEVGRGIVITNFIDTTAANNVSYMKGTPYIEIRTSDNKIWRRNVTATQWVQLGGNSGGGSGIDSTAHYTITQQSDSLYALFEKRNGGKDTLTFLGIPSGSGGLGVTSYGKNAGGDSTILLLSNGTRYAAKDSVGGGGGWGLTGNASAVTDFLGTTNNRTMRFRTNNVERMVIDSTGSVGIGTSTNAGYKLDVFGPVRLYPRGNINGGFEFTYNDVYNIMHSNALTYISSNNALFIGGIGYTMLGINKNDTQSKVLIGYESWQGGSASASAKLDIKSTTQGILIPRMTTTERNAIATPATGLQVYNTTTNTNDVYNGAAWSSEPLIVTNRQTANYTLVIGDIGELVEANVATANTLTVPLNSVVAFPIGSKIDVAQYGAGQTTITATGGVTIRSFGGALKIAGQYGAATLVKIGTDEWYCFGNLSL